MRVFVMHEVNGLRLDRHRAARLFDHLLDDLENEPAAEDHISTLSLKRVMADLPSSQAESLLDPACGMGGLLVAAAGRFVPAG